jgi:hypothetical protein
VLWLGPDVEKVVEMEEALLSLRSGNAHKRKKLKVVDYVKL